MTVASTDAPTPNTPEPRLWNRNFLLLWQGQLVSQLGNQAFAIAMMYWLMEATGSASLMGTIMMASTLPGVLLGPVGGTFADRHSRVKIIVASDTIHGLAVLALFAVVWLRPEAHGLIIGMLFVTAVVGGVVNAVFLPAISAAIPDLVPPARLAAANSLNQFSVQATTFVGQAIGGVLYRMLGAPMLFLIDGVSYLLSALSESFIRAPSRERATGPGVTEGPQRTKGEGATEEPVLPAGVEPPPTFRGALAGYRNDTIDGIRFVWERTGMRSFLLLAATVNFLVMPIVVLLPFFVSMRLGAGPEWYGFLLAILGVGSILGYALAGGVPVSAKRRPTAVVTAFLVVGASFVVLGQIHDTWPALATFAAVGMGSGLINIYVLTLLQSATPADMRGRVMALVVTMSLGAAPIGMGLGGLVGDLTDKNIPLIYGACGALMIVATGLAAIRRPFREFLSTES